MTKKNIITVFVVLISSFALINAQNKTVEQVLEGKILTEEGQGAVVVNGIELYSQVELPQFYSNRDFEPAWNNAKNKKDLIESLESSFDEGLIPNDYHLERIKKLQEKSQKSKLSHEEKADLDLLMTDAIILYASHLLEGKLEQSDLRKTWDVERNEGPSNPENL